jgi:uncharacterized protein (TIGR03086 family)
VAWKDDSLLERDAALPWATFPGSVVAQIYTLEPVTHSWDLAAATGQVNKLDPDLADLVLALATQMVPPETPGGEMPFEARVAVPDEAPAYDRLAGFLGRQPV